MACPPGQVLHKAAHSIPLGQAAFNIEPPSSWRHYYTNVSIHWHEEESDEDKILNWNRSVDILYPRR